MPKQHQSSSSSTPFFPFPIFPPHLASYNVPAPVIIPPGSDPSLLNPNPYHHQVLETSSSMDIDPCVVAWGESFMKKADLTASEHAGVSLTGPATMGSTAFTDLEVVAPVNITCNSENAFMKHMEENIQLKNTQKLTGSSTINQGSEKKNSGLEKITQIVSTVIQQETPSPVATRTLNQEYPKSLFVCDIPEPGRVYPKIATVEVDQSLIKNPTVEPSNCATQNKLSVHQLHHRCDICKVSCSGDKSFYQHITGKQHQNNLKLSEKTPTPPPINVITSMNTLTMTMEEPKSMDIAGKQHQNNLKLSEKTPTPPRTTSTTSTNTTLITKTMQESKPMDIAGKQHQNNLIISEKTPTPIRIMSITSMDTTPIAKTLEEPKLLEHNGKTTWCEICKASCSNDYDRHLSGRRHMKNLQKLEKIPKSPSTVIDSVTAPHAEKLKLIRGEVVNPNEGGNTSCELCGVYCTSRDVFNEHISGKKHQKKLKKIEQQLVSKTRLAEPMNEEGEIVILEGSKRKGNDSLSSEEDADAKRQKMNEKEEACGLLVTCKICNVGCYGLVAFNLHLAGFEHSAMLLKQGKGGSNGLHV